MLWWRIYFIFIICLIIIGVVVVFTGSSSFYLIDWVSTILGISIPIAVYSIINHKNFGSVRDWKIVLWVIIILEILGIIYATTPPGAIKNLLFFMKSGIPFEEGDGKYLILSYAFVLPGYYAIYKLAYSKANSPAKQKSNYKR